MRLSIFPAVNLFLGFGVFEKFQGSFEDFKWKNVDKIYNNYSIQSMYIMFLVDFFVYFFIGFYLQNIVSHDFGISRPFYFLCTKRYWCKSKSKRLLTHSEQENNVLKLNKNNPNFQSEDLYKDRTKPTDMMKIRNIIKTFGDGKTAVDGVSINLYKDEISKKNVVLPNIPFSKLP